MNGGGEPASKSATHLCGVPSAMYCKFGTKRCLASQYPRRGRGRVLTAQRQGRRQKLSPKLPRFGRPARPRNRSETPKEDLGKRWPLSTSTTATRTKISWIPAFPVGVRNRPAEVGCANPVSLSRIASRTAESASPSKNFPLHWRGGLAQGSSARRPMPHTGSRGLASANRLLPVLKR